MEIEVAPSFQRSAKAYRDRADEIKTALETLKASWGHPHLHHGIGIRRLKGTNDFFEFRVRLHLRVVFERTGKNLRLLLCGTHDEIQSWIRNMA